MIETAVLASRKGEGLWSKSVSGHHIGMLFNVYFSTSFSSTYCFPISLVHIPSSLSLAANTEPIAHSTVLPGGLTQRQYTVAIPSSVGQAMSSLCFTNSSNNQSSGHQSSGQYQQQQQQQGHQGQQGQQTQAQQHQPGRMSHSSSGGRQGGHMMVDQMGGVYGGVQQQHRHNKYGSQQMNWWSGAILGMNELNWQIFEAALVNPFFATVKINLNFRRTVQWNSLLV